MPEFFQRLKPFLPFTYGIQAMRGAVAGLYKNQYWSNLFHLLWYLPLALFVGLAVRRLAMNLNALFDNRLADTDLMITERNAGIDSQLRFVNRVQRFAQDYPQIAHDRARLFFKRYPRLVRIGFIALGVLPFVFLVLLFVIPQKIGMLTAWIVSIIAIDTYLIVVEYMRERYASTLGEQEMSADEFRNAILHENLLFHKGMSYRPMHAAGRHIESRRMEERHAGPEHAEPGTLVERVLQAERKQAEDRHAESHDDETRGEAR